MPFFKNFFVCLQFSFHPKQALCKIPFSGASPKNTDCSLPSVFCSSPCPFSVILRRRIFTAQPFLYENTSSPRNRSFGSVLSRKERVRKSVFHRDGDLFPQGLYCFCHPPARNKYVLFRRAVKRRRFASRPKSSFDGGNIRSVFGIKKKGDPSRCLFCKGHLSSPFCPFSPFPFFRKFILSSIVIQSDSSFMLSFGSSFHKS